MPFDSAVSVTVSRRRFSEGKSAVADLPKRIRFRQGYATNLFHVAIDRAIGPIRIGLVRDTTVLDSVLFVAS